MKKNSKMIQINKSKIHGKGVFAENAISQGERFYEIPMDNVSNIPKKRWAKIGNVWVGDEKVLNYINHSCDPNSKIKITDQSALIAITDIQPGDEITVDYNLTEQNGKKVPCNCHTKNCKGYFLVDN